MERHENIICNHIKRKNNVKGERIDANYDKWDYRYTSYGAISKYIVIKTERMNMQRYV